MGLSFETLIKITKNHKVFFLFLFFTEHNSTFLTSNLVSNGTSMFLIFSLTAFVTAILNHISSSWHCLLMASTSVPMTTFCSDNDFVFF